MTFASVFSSPEVTPVWYVKIELGSGASYEFVSGQQAIEGRYPCVDKVENVAGELSISEKLYTSQVATVTMRRDGVASAMVQGQYLKNARVTVKLASPDLALSDAVWVGTYRLDDVAISETGYTFTCVNLLAILAGVSQGSTLDLWPAHPLTQILRVLQFCNVPASLYDDTTFDPAAYPAWSHWNCMALRQGTAGTSLYGDAHGEALWGDFGSLAKDGALLKQVLEPLMRHVPGYIVPDASGVLGFSEAQPSVAITRHIEAWEIDKCEVLGLYTDLANTIDVGFLQRPDGAYTAKWRVDSNHTVHLFPGTVASEFTHKLELPACNGLGRLMNNPGLTGTDFRVHFSVLSGFCGANVTDSLPWARYITADKTSYSQAWQRLSVPDGRVAYLRISGYPHDPASQASPYSSEVVKATAMALYDPATMPDAEQRLISTPGLGGSASAWMPAHAVWTVTRAQLGTTAKNWVAWGGTPPDYTTGTAGTGAYRPIVEDITIQVALAQALADRLLNGAPEVMLHTRLRHSDLLLNQLISFDHGMFENNGLSAADSTTVWQIVGKQVILGDSPECRLKLKWVRHNVAPTAVTTTVDVGPEVVSGTENVVDFEGKILMDLTGRNILAGA